MPVMQHNRHAQLMACAGDPFLAGHLISSNTVAGRREGVQHIWEPDTAPRCVASVNPLHLAPNKAVRSHRRCA